MNADSEHCHEEGALCDHTVVSIQVGLKISVCVPALLSLRAPAVFHSTRDPWRLLLL
jgi:hypothetical protein